MCIEMIEKFNRDNYWMRIENDFYYEIIKKY